MMKKAIAMALVIGLIVGNMVAFAGHLENDGIDAMPTLNSPQANLTANHSTEWNGTIQSVSSSSSNAYTGSGSTKTITSGSYKIGWTVSVSPTLVVYWRSVASFNTSAIPDDAYIESVEISVKYVSKTITGSASDFDIFFYSKDIGDSLDTNDFYTTGSTYIANVFSTSSSTGVFYNYTDTSDFSYLNKTGVTQFQIQRGTGASNPPPFNPSVPAVTGEFAILSDMKLNITYAENNAPIVDAGTNQSGLKGIYDLNGTATDSDGTVANYTWNFTHDGSPVELYGANASFNFTELGTYDVNLTVTDDRGKEGYDNVTIQINASYPSADAGVNQTGKRTLILDGSGSSDVDGTIDNYTWNFTYDSNPVELYGVSPSFDFNITGNYTIMLNVTDDDSLNGFDNVTMFVTLADPVADAGVPQGTLKGIYSLDGSGSTDSDGTIMNYTWAFTDGGSPVTLYGVNPSYNFTQNVDHEITLTVRDDDWRTNASKTWVNITWIEPTPIGNYTPYNSNKGLKTFTSTSYDTDGYLIETAWEFTYNGTPYEYYGETFDFNFSLEGNYTVELIVTDDDSWDVSAYLYVNITFLNPVANISENKTVVRWNDVWLDGSGSTDEDGYIVNWTWQLDWGNETYYVYGEEMTYFFNQTGNYTITLTVTDDNGLTNSTTGVYTVVDPLEETAGFLILLIPLVIILLLIIVIVEYFKKHSNENIEYKNKGFV